MIHKILSRCVFLGLFTISLGSSAQLLINNATFVVQTGATVTVQGNLTSNVDITGAGKILMQGTSLQNINMNGFAIPNLELNNPANVALTGNLKVGSSLTFSSLTVGKLLTGDFNLTLSEVATVTGPGPGEFVETNGNGQLIKTLTANVSALVLPLGEGTIYRPASLTTVGTYSNANVGIRLKAIVDPNKPAMISDYVRAHWPVTKTGITGTVTVSGQYDATDIAGSEPNLRGYFYNGTDWSSVGGTNNAALNTVTAPITTATGDVYGMNKFILSKVKVFLQGAYNSTTGIMSDALRTPTNLIPLSDPYRVAPYNFVQVSNPLAETAAASVFNDKPITNDNIVDWVFLELRNNGSAPGNNILQTRSALVKRDGNIVDVDGVSPVTFNNVANGSYTIAVRHRNHLGLSADPLTNLLALAEAKSTAPLLDLTSATDAQIFGTSAAYTVIGGKNVLWGGNANFNNNSKYTGPANDKDYLLGTILGGVSTATVNGYSAGDLNFNRSAKYTGPGNDKDFLLGTILTSTATTIRTQALPQ